jgi:monovalent cation:H+ antiporter-2, CPA2 family
MNHDVSRIFIELGAAVVGLAALARIASRWGFSAIPLYLLAGLAFGNGGLLPLNVSENFIHIGAEIGVLLLLFMLGLEYTGDELRISLKRGVSAGLMDLLLNFPPGLIAGVLLGWHPLAAVLLGGITYVSSSGIIAKVMAELKRLGKPETPVVLSMLVLEDLAMAVYLPLVAVLLVGGSIEKMTISVCFAVIAVSTILLVAIRYGEALSRLLAHESDEIILLSTFGGLVLIAGVAQWLQVSAAIGAFLVGIAVSGPIADQSRRLLTPVRDLFAATFFFFFGLQIDPASLVPAFWYALALGIATTLTKVLAGYWAVGKAGGDTRACLRAGATLVARGEFSIIIAGLGSSLEPRLGPLAAAYVLLLAVLGPILARAFK